MHSGLFSLFVRECISNCNSQTDTWRSLSRFGLTASKKNQSLNISPADFADFLLDVPGGPGPCPNFEVLLLSIDLAFDPVKFYFKNVTTEDIIREVLKLSGYQALGPDDVHMSQLVDGLEFLAPLMADLLTQFYPVLSTLKPGNGQ